MASWLRSIFKFKAPSTAPSEPPPSKPVDAVQVALDRGEWARLSTMGAPAAAALLDRLRMAAPFPPEAAAALAALAPANLRHEMLVALDPPDVEAAVRNAAPSSRDAVRLALETAPEAARRAAQVLVAAADVEAIPELRCLLDRRGGTFQPAASALLGLLARLPATDGNTAERASVALSAKLVEHFDTLDGRALPCIWQRLAGEPSVPAATELTDARTAIDAAGRVRGAGVVDALLIALDHPNPRVRMAAARAFERNPPLTPATSGALKRSLMDESPEVAKTAAESLGRLGWTPPDDDDRGWQNVAIAGFEAVAHQGSEGARFVARVVANGTVPEPTRLRAAEVLAFATVASEGVTEEIPALARLAVDGKLPPSVASKVLVALGMVNDPRQKSALLELVDASVAEVRVRALMALGRMKDPSLRQRFMQALWDPDWNVSNVAAQALEILGWTPTTPEDTVRFGVAYKGAVSVDGLGIAAAPLLLAVVDDPASHSASPIMAVRSPSVLANAVEALNRIQPSPWTQDAVAKLLGSPALATSEPSERLLALASDAVLAVEGPRAAAALRDHIRHVQPRIRLSVVRAIAIDPDDEARRLLFEALDDVDVGIRQRAAQILLGRRRKPETRAEIARVLEEVKEFSSVKEGLGALLETAAGREALYDIPRKRRAELLDAVYNGLPPEGWPQEDRALVTITCKPDANSVAAFGASAFKGLAVSLADPEVDVRLLVVDVLGRLAGSAEARALLEGAMVPSQPEALVLAALEAPINATERIRASTLKALLGHPSRRVRERVVERFMQTEPEGSSWASSAADLVAETARVAAQAVRYQEYDRLHKVALELTGRLAGLRGVEADRGLDEVLVADGSPWEARELAGRALLEREGDRSSKTDAWIAVVDGRHDDAVALGSVAAAPLLKAYEHWRGKRSIEAKRPLEALGSLLELNGESFDADELRRVARLESVMEQHREGHGDDWFEWESVVVDASAVCEKARALLATLEKT